MALAIENSAISRICCAVSFVVLFTRSFNDNDSEGAQLLIKLNQSKMWIWIFLREKINCTRVRFAHMDGTPGIPVLFP
jgi:hypothetical protein